MSDHEPFFRARVALDVGPDCVITFRDVLLRGLHLRLELLTHGESTIAPN